MKTSVSLKNRQGGAVAVMVGFCLVLLIGFLALVIDLGHLYVAKTGLQNAADAAALSGAKELDGTTTGISNAVAKAVEAGELNSFFGATAQQSVELGLGTNLSNQSIWFGSSPSGTNWYHGSDSEVQSNPGDKYFIKVDTASGTLATWFAPIWGIFNTNTYGMAIAGRSILKITPLAICAIDVRQCPCLKNESQPCGQTNGQCGYEPGKSYSLNGVNGVNPIGPGTPLWIDGAATSSNPTCSGSVPATLPYVCRGEAYVSATPGDYVYTNTGLSTPQLAALDSRFGDYDPQGKCDSATAPPDRNIQEFRPPISGCTPAACTYTAANACNADPVCKWNAGSCVPVPPPAGCSNSFNWMTPPPTVQTSVCTTNSTDQYGGNIYNCPWSTPANGNGVYWSAVSGVAASGVAPNSSYPASGTPYSQTLTSTHPEYFESGGSGQLDGRRLLNLVIVQCTAAGGNCRPARNRMVGQFLLQTRANISGEKQVNVEFVRMASQQEIAAEIRLYR